MQLGRAHEQIIQPLERFRKDHIGAVKVKCLIVIRANCKVEGTRYKILHC